MQNFISIPFSTEGTHGLAQVNGVAKFSPAGIVLEFEKKWLGLVSGGVEEARIPIGEILDIKFRKGVLKRSAKIEIRMKTFGVLAALPNQDGKLTLKLVRDDIERGERAVAALHQDMAEYAAELPPPHPPLRSLFDESENDTQKLDQ